MRHSDGSWRYGRSRPYPDEAPLVTNLFGLADLIGAVRSWDAPQPFELEDGTPTSGITLISLGHPKMQASAFTVMFMRELLPHARRPRQRNHRARVTDVLGGYGW